ncbi:MAG: PilZ domain-containing protein [Tepidisphaeraceae bacterium]
MKLSQELYQQIMTGLRSDKSRDNDKRREPRAGLSCEAELVNPIESGTRRSARVTIRDISRLGIGLLTPWSLAINQQFIIAVPGEAGTHWLLCTTVRSQRVDDHIHKIGATHGKLLTLAEVRELAGSLLAPRSAGVEIDRIRMAILG